MAGCHIQGGPLPVVWWGPDTIFYLSEQSDRGEIMKKDPKDDPKTAEEYLECFGERIDDIAEDNDHLGTCLGIAFTQHCIQRPLDNPYPGSHTKPEWVNIVQLVFEHGIVDARRDTLELLSIRTLTRFDPIKAK